MMSIPKYVSDVLNRLEENGFSAYVVGGCVRDYLLGRPINDFDVATSALPEEMLEIFKDSNSELSEEFSFLQIMLGKPVVVKFFFPRIPIKINF